MRNLYSLRNCLAALFCCIVANVSAQTYVFDFDCTTDGGVALTTKGLSTKSTTDGIDLTAKLNDVSYVWSIKTSSTTKKVTVAKNQDALQIGTSKNPQGTFTMTLQTSIENIKAITVEAYANSTSTLSVGVGDADGTVKTAFAYAKDGETTVAPTSTATKYLFEGSAVASGNIILSGNNEKNYLKIKNIKIYLEDDEIDSADQPVAVPTFSSLEDLVASEEAVSGTEVKVSFENVCISSIFTTTAGYRNGVYLNVQKDDSNIEIYFKNVPDEWISNGTLSGTLNATWTYYSSGKVWELVPSSTWAWNKLTYTAPEPTYILEEINFIAQDENGTYYATYSNKDVTFIPDDVTVCYVTVGDDGKLVLTELDKHTIVMEEEDGPVTVYYVPANTGVLIYSTETTVNRWTVEDLYVAPASNNQLKASSVAMATSGYKYYKLTYGDSSAKTGLGFYYGAADGGAFTSAEDLAYLAVPEAVTSAKAFTFSGTATAIQNVETSADDAAIYNLSGQRLSQMRKGINIVGGKKYIVK